MNQRENPPIKYEYYDWNQIIKRLRYHRQRLNLSPEEVKMLIRQKYHCEFIRLSDEKIIELGMTFKACQTQADFYQAMENG